MVQSTLVQSDVLSTRHSNSLSGRTVWTRLSLERSAGRKGKNFWIIHQLPHSELKECACTSRRLPTWPEIKDKHLIRCIALSILLLPEFIIATTASLPPPPHTHIVIPRTTGSNSFLLLLLLLLLLSLSLSLS